MIVGAVWLLVGCSSRPHEIIKIAPPTAYTQLPPKPALPDTVRLSNMDVATWMIAIDNYADTCVYQMGLIQEWGSNHADQ